MSRVSYYDDSDGYYDNSGGYFVDTPRHGGPKPLDLATWFGPDPGLALVTGDLDAWLDAHPCDCEALCVCEGPEE